MSFTSKTGAVEPESELDPAVERRESENTEDELIPRQYRSGDPERPYKYTDVRGNEYFYFKYPFFSAAIFILLLEALERFSYYCLQPEYNRYLTNPVFASLSVSEASSLIKLMSGLGYMWPMVSAAMADSFLGMYRGILLFGAIYFSALILFTISGSPALYQPWMTQFYFLFWFPIGFGGVKSLIGTMGATCYHPVIHKGQLAQYYLRFYMLINIGSLLSTLVNIMANMVGDEMWIPFLIPACTFLIGMFIFVWFRNRYVHREPLGSAIVELLKIGSSSVQACPPSLEKQKIENGGKFETTFVEDVRLFSSLVPLLLTQTFMMMAYWIMDTYILFAGLELEQTWGIQTNVLNSFMNPLSVITCGFVVDRVLLPQLAKRGIVLTHVHKFMIGNTLAGLAMVYAALFNYAAQSSWSPIQSENLSILWCAPVYVLIACAEIFVNPVAYELAFVVAPQSLKTTAGSITSFFSGMIPNFLSAIIAAAAGGYQVDQNGCSSRLDKKCEHIHFNENGQGVWDYPSVDFSMMFWISGVFPLAGIFYCVLINKYYNRTMEIVEEQADRANQTDAEDAVLKTSNSVSGDVVIKQ